VYDHPDWAGFVAAIRADPADDTVRLIAADWLEEYDPERAEFIRTHLAYYAARHNHRHQSFGGEPCRKCKLKRRLKKLWHLPGKGLPSGIWGRLPAGGFLTTVDCSAAAWLAHGDAVLAREPVERVTLTSYPPFYWFMNNLPPNWPAGGRHSPVERPVALDALEHCWPGVAFTLPPEPVQRWQVTEPDGPDASSADWLVRYVRDAVARGTAEHIDRQFRAG
jgi:uncharacterized protein (TIGR02996 family)